MAESRKAGVAENEIETQREDDVDAGDNQDVEEVFH